MITFQFDQCFNDKKVIKTCADEGLAGALRFPREWWDKPDPDLLADVMMSPNPLVTLDRALPREHAAHVPARHPGIVIVNYSRAIPRTITTKEAGKILNHFKQRVTNWHHRAVRNSIVEITEMSAEVWHVEDGELVRDGYLEFHDASDWAAQLIQLLTQNADRDQTPPPGQSDGVS
jgi:hypothetical protein